MNKTTTCLLACAAFSVLAGCQSQNTSNTKKTGSYTAARRNTTGSHIPQPYSADSVDSTMDTDAFLRQQQQMSNTNSSMGGGGRGGR